jgi:osmotically-inducible protein OsmY
MKTIKNVFGKSLVLAGVVLLGLAGCANTGEKSGVYVDDSVITSKVKTEMATNKEIKAHNITVNTSKGVVTLSGTAATMDESLKAAQIARNVAGVKSVENDIRVQ